MRSQVWERGLGGGGHEWGQDGWCEGPWGLPLVKQEGVVPHESKDLRLQTPWTLCWRTSAHVAVPLLTLTQVSELYGMTGDGHRKFSQSQVGRPWLSQGN